MRFKFNYRYLIAILTLFLSLIFFAHEISAMEIINRAVLIFDSEDSYDEVTVENIDALALEHLEEKDSDIDLGSLRLSKKYCDVPFHKDQKQGICSAFFQQYYDELLVWSSLVSATSINGKFVHENLTYFYGIDISTRPEIEEERAIEIVQGRLSTEKKPELVELVVFPHGSDLDRIYSLSWKIDMPMTHDDRVMTLFIDAISGRTLYDYNRVDYQIGAKGSVIGKIYPRHVGQTQVSKPFSHNTINVNGKDVVSNSTGEFPVLQTAKNMIRAKLDGPYVSVSNASAASASYSGSDVNVDWFKYDKSYRQQESNLFYHVNVAHDYFTRGGPFDIHKLNFPVPAVADVPSTGTWDCNAKCVYYTNPKSFRIMFAGLGSCSPMALNADSIYHEYTHGVTHYIYTYSKNEYEFEAMREAYSDYFASTMTNDFCFGRNSHPSKNCLRLLNNKNRMFVFDYMGSSHEYSQVLSGSLWDLRQAIGHALTDELVIRSMKLEPYDYTAFLKAMLTIDDDNGNLSDGTPHQSEICKSFYDNHGIYSPLCAKSVVFPVIYITRPWMWEIVKGSKLDIVGTAMGGKNSLKSFSIEYSTDRSFYSGVTQLLKSSKTVNDDILATLDTTKLSSGDYFIRLSAIDIVGNKVTFETSFYLQKDAHPGWPKQVGKSFQFPPVVVDIDGDGKKETIINDAESVFVWDHNGNMKKGWPVKPTLSHNTRTMTTPLAVADIDLDGKSEIIVGTNAGLIIFTHDGKNYPGWPYIFRDEQGRETLFDILGTPAVQNLDGQLRFEIVASAADGKLYVWHEDGCLMKGWPVQVMPQKEIDNNRTISSPAIADIDGDGDYEIVISAMTTPGSVAAFHHDGNYVKGWPQVFGQTQDQYKVWLLSPKQLISSPLLIDYDRDGYPEVYVGAPYIDGKVYGWNYKGQIIAGFPRELVSNKNGAPYYTISSPAPGGWISAADTYRNFDPKLAFFSALSQLYPYVTTPILTGTDLNSGIVLSRSGNDSLINAHFLANPLLYKGFPILCPNSAVNFITVDDTDGDGLIEMVVATEPESTEEPLGSSLGGGVYIFDLDEKYNPSMLWPMFRGNPRNTGTYPSSKLTCESEVKSLIANLEFQRTALNPRWRPYSSSKEMLDDMSGKIKCLFNNGICGEEAFEKIYEVLFQEKLNISLVTDQLPNIKVMGEATNLCCTNYSVFLEAFWANINKGKEVRIEPNYLKYARQKLGDLKNEVCHQGYRRHCN